MISFVEGCFVCALTLFSSQTVIHTHPHTQSCHACGTCDVMHLSYESGPNKSPVALCKQRGPMWGTGNANLDALLGDLLAEDGGESPEYESEDEVEEEEDEEEEEEEEAVPLERCVAMNFRRADRQPASVSSRTSHRLKPNSKFLSRLMKSTERTNARIADEVRVQRIDDNCSRACTPSSLPPPCILLLIGVW